MFDDVEDVVSMVELAQSAADRHMIPFYIVHRRGRLELTSLSPAGHYLERITPRQDLI